MSADNGVFILETKGKSGPEYRVTYAQAIDSIYGTIDDETGKWEGDMECMVSYFGRSKVYTILEEALDVAENMSHNYDYLEYGVCLITDFAHLTFGQK